MSIKIPADNDPSNIIRVEGSPEGVAMAKQELLEMVHKMVRPAILPPPPPPASENIVIIHHYGKRSSVRSSSDGPPHYKLCRNDMALWIQYLDPLSV